ncbi:hypothetical protein [Lentzea albida]|uniref:Uncharacterized protein n=1 Tax=Lentzea albida TaxID=65499 RepID=A0A1H9KBA2_9PSEU|nr:hypothetical protein [Lentzea albida]SEQ96362.1 hypothetical protein SAMN04488000_105257 [Lentzea albida]
MFRRKQEKRRLSDAEHYARELGARVHAVSNKIHPAPTQRRLVDSLITRPGGLVAVLESVSQCSQLVPPGALGNQVPVEVPVSGHNLVLTLINRSDRPITVSGVRAVLRSVTEYEFPAQLCSTPPRTTLAYGEDLRTSTENAREGFQNLKRPHLEVHLDGVRPLIAEALLPDGERVGEPAPLTVGARRAETVVLCPVTTRTGCVSWRLVIRWHEDGDVLHSAWDLLATGFSGWTITSPDGGVVSRPLDQLGHWDPVTTWEGGGTFYDEHLGLAVTPDQAWLDAIRYD